MRRFVTTVATASVALLMVSAASATTAAADPGTDGFWYFDLPGIQAIHDAGITGEGVTIAVIDSQINPDVPTLQGADIEVQPSLCWEEDGSPISVTSTDLEADHGTNIVSFLVGTGAGYPGQTGVKGVAPDAKILYFSSGRSTEDGSIVCFTESGVENSDPAEEDAVGEAIFRSIDAGVDIISISQGTTYHPYVELAIAHAIHEGIVVVAGLPNRSAIDEGFMDQAGPYPAAYNGVVSVQAGDSGAGTMEDHVDERTDVVAPGVQMVWQGDGTWELQRYARGTSLATPMVSGFLALVAQKYPEATANQLIQSLIRNTGTEDHELSFDAVSGFGYGTASASHMLRVDPTQYDDENPLVVDGDAETPTRAEIENPIAQENWDQLDEVVDEPSPLAETGPVPVPVLAVIGGVLLLVALIVIVIIVLATRRARANRTTPPA